MKKRFLASALAAGLGFAGAAPAHFQMIIPAVDMVENPAQRQVNLDVKFWHPFEGMGMSMAKPVKFGVRAGGENIDLLNTLKEKTFIDIEKKKYNGFAANFAIKKPGDHVFYAEPAPYWEPAEETFIIHYTKVVVNALGLEAGWDDELGLKTEIVPLTRPYGLYAGNVFQGVVKLNGKPVPHSTVEVEYYNEDGKRKAPAAPFITQAVKADANGVFTYAMPRAGWWGFAALNEDGKKMKHEGKDYPVELGAVIWVKTQDMK